MSSESRSILPTKRKLTGSFAGALIFTSLAFAAATGPKAESAPEAAQVIKPALLKKVMGDREALAHASLDDVPEPDSARKQGLSKLKKYSFQAAMLTRTGLTHTREVLTDYAIYAKLIPYIDRAQYHPDTHLLNLEGGIWKWRLASVLHFDQVSDRWIRFQVVGGHFKGLTGDMVFEPQGDKGTLVFMRGEQEGRHWPPAFIIEQGAQIVFEFTARRMRSYLESPIDPNGSGRSHELNKNAPLDIPQPRSHL